MLSSLHCFYSCSSLEILNNILLLWWKRQHIWLPVNFFISIDSLHSSGRINAIGQPRKKLLYLRFVGTDCVLCARVRWMHIRKKDGTTVKLSSYKSYVFMTLVEKTCFLTIHSSLLLKMIRSKHQLVLRYFLSWFLTEIYHPFFFITTTSYRFSKFSH